MTAKIEGSGDRNYVKVMEKKVTCSKHKQRFVLKCEHPDCESPYICWNQKCLQMHKHASCIMVNSFRTEEMSQKFIEIDNLICDDTIYQNAKTLKNYIEGLKESIKNVYVGIKSINQSYDSIKEDLDQPLSTEYMSKVDETYNLNQMIRNKIEEIKEKVNLEFSIKDSYFQARCQLIGFLTQNIQGLNWSKSQELYSSKSEPISCQKFHEKLFGTKDLIFIYIGEDKILGSYYHESYPSLLEKSVNDPSSFLFLSDKKEGSISKIYKFEAIAEADSHMSVDSKSYICQGNNIFYGDGIRTSHKNFENVQYSLPSTTFKAEETMTENLNTTFNGILKPRRFMILKAHIEKSNPHNADYSIIEDSSVEVPNESGQNGVALQKLDNVTVANGN